MTSFRQKKVPIAFLEMLEIYLKSIGGGVIFMHFGRIIDTFGLEVQ